MKTADSAKLKNGSTFFSDYQCVFLAFWVVVALLLTFLSHMALLQSTFDYPGASFPSIYGWVSAHCAQMARSFVEHGILELGGVPIQNNPPIGLEPDAYLHWPPFFFMLLSVVFRLFGESEAVAHGLMLIILVANCFAVYALVATCADRRAGLLASFGALVMPATVVYGNLVLPLNLSIFAMLLAILGFVRATAHERLHSGWAWFGAISLVISVLFSWESLLAYPGLLAMALWRGSKSHVRLALLYSGVAVAAFASIIILYLINSPSLVAELWHVIQYRTGFSPSYSAEAPVHLLFRETTYAAEGAAIADVTSLFRMVTRFVGRLEFIGTFGTLAVGAVIMSAGIRRRKGAGGQLAFAFAGMLAPWILWFALMPKHAYDHEYEMLLAVPIAASALGIGTVRVLDLTSRLNHQQWLRDLPSVILIVLPMVMLLPLAQEAKGRLLNPARETLETEMIAFAHEVKDLTEPGSVVIVPYISMVPVYYSERHVIRGAVNDELVKIIARQVPEILPDSNVYLAVPAVQHDDFTAALQRYEIVKSTPTLTLLIVTESKTDRVR